jgi:hypothetical protein
MEGRLRGQRQKGPAGRAAVHYRSQYGFGSRSDDPLDVRGSPNGEISSSQ